MYNPPVCPRWAPAGSGARARLGSARVEALTTKKDLAARCRLTMDGFWNRLYRALKRVIPSCIGQAQAVAFNMFLASMPMLLIVMGVVSTSARLADGFNELIMRLRTVLPPGVHVIILRFIVHHSTHPWRWISLGLGGTLLAGTQMMRLVIDGFQMMNGDSKGHGWWSKQFRAMLLLLATLAPWLLAANLLVFAKQVRIWLIGRSGLPLLVRLLWVGLYVTMALVMAMLVLAVIYRVGRPSRASWRGGEPVLPGAILATLLWWLVSSAFGFYMRHVPYELVYGGLAVAIGLMLWMQLTATILFLGAAFNAEGSSPKG